MKSVTSAYKTAVKDYGRTFENEVVITDGTTTETYTNAEITINETFSEDDSLSMGAYFSSEAKIKLYEPTGSVAYKNCSYTINSKLLVGSSYESVAMGVFYPSEVKKNDGSIEITAYDMMSRLQDDYEPTISEPCFDSDVIKDICTQKGVTIGDVGTTIGGAGCQVLNHSIFKNSHFSGQGNWSVGKYNAVCDTTAQTGSLTYDSDTDYYHRNYVWSGMTTDSVIRNDTDYPIIVSALWGTYVSYVGYRYYGCINQSVSAHSSYTLDGDMYSGEYSMALSINGDYTGGLYVDETEIVSGTTPTYDITTSTDATTGVTTITSLYEYSGGAICNLINTSSSTPMTLTNSHKYLFFITGDGLSDLSSLKYQYYYCETSGSTQYVNITPETIFTAPSCESYRITPQMYAISFYVSNFVGVLKNTFQMIDLTEKYGEGNEPTSYAEYVADYGTDYVAYGESHSWVGLHTNVSLVEGTCAEQLGWLAGLQGKNAVFNEEGKLEFRWYALQSETLSRADQVENGCSLDEGSFTIASLTSGTTDNVITCGTGKGLSFTNPYMTSTLLTTIWNALGNKTLYTGSVENFGFPMYEVGDIVNVVDKEGTSRVFYLSNNSWTFSGGCHCTSQSVGNPDAEIEFDTTTPQAIGSVASSLKEAEKKFSNIINTESGVYSITEEDGVTTGWTIVDNPTSPTKIIKATNGGIGISSNGGSSYSTAITGEGIVASTITSGTMYADRIKGGTLSLGGNNNINGAISVTNASGTEIGSWNNSGITIVGGSTANPVFLAKDSGNASNIIITPQVITMIDNNAGTSLVEIAANSTTHEGAFAVAGDVTCNTLYYYTLSPRSREELKEDITPIDVNGLDIVNSADLYSFKYKDVNNDYTRYGVIIGDNYNTPNEILSFKENEAQGVDLLNYTSILWKAVQELSQEVESLKQQLEEGGNDK